MSDETRLDAIERTANQSLATANQALSAVAELRGEVRSSVGRLENEDVKTDSRLTKIEAKIRNGAIVAGGVPSLVVLVVEGLKAAGVLPR